MSQKTIIGTPPLGEQTHSVLIGRLISEDVVIQTDNGWVTIKKEDVGSTAATLKQMVVNEKE